MWLLATIRMATQRKSTCAWLGLVAKHSRCWTVARWFNWSTEICDHIDSIVSTINPAISSDGSDASSAPRPQTDPHVYEKPFKDVQDFQQDLIQLIATCQRHTKCSESYCLQTRNGQQVCRCGYPKPLQSTTTLHVQDGNVELITARNDPLVNSHNPIQLCSWRANVDMQFYYSRRKVIEYCSEYATKSEPRSQPLKDTFKRIVSHLDDQDRPLKAVQKLLISSVTCSVCRSTSHAVPSPRAPPISSFVGQVYLDQICHQLLCFHPDLEWQSP